MMLLNPFDLAFTVMGRLMGTVVPQYRPPSQPPAAGPRPLVQRPELPALRSERK